MVHLWWQQTRVDKECLLVANDSCCHLPLLRSFYAGLQTHVLHYFHLLLHGTKHLEHPTKVVQCPRMPPKLSTSGQAKLCEAVVVLLERLISLTIWHVMVVQWQNWMICTLSDLWWSCSSANICTWMSERVSELVNVSNMNVSELESCYLWPLGLAYSMTRHTILLGFTMRSSQ